MPTSITVTNGTGGTYAFSYTWPSGNANCTTLNAALTGNTSDTSTATASVLPVG